MPKSIKVTSMFLIVVGILYAPTDEATTKDQSRVWLDATRGWVESADSNFCPYTDSIDVGIGTQNPQGKLDVNGDIILRMTTYAVSSGLDDIDFGPYSFVRIDGATANYEITGIAGGVDGRMLILYNNSQERMRLKNESLSSQPACRIITVEQGDTDIRRYGGVILMYDDLAQRWRVIQNRRD